MRVKYYLDILIKRNVLTFFHINAVFSISCWWNCNRNRSTRGTSVGLTTLYITLFFTIGNAFAKLIMGFMKNKRRKHKL